MAVKMEKPNPTLPVGYRPANSFPYRVKNGDSFTSVASRLGMTSKALLQFNFNTDYPQYINYYLHHNVGCKVPTPDGKNYTFTNASPGIIYYPAFNPVVFFGTKEAGTTFNNYPIHGLIATDDPENNDLIRVWAAFHVGMVLNPKILDPRPFVYRQYIKGRCRVADEKDHWHEFTLHTSKTPHVRPSTMTKADLQTWNTEEFREDAEWFENKTIGTAEVRKYGYREEKPADIDKYLPDQNGHSYQCIDLPGIRVPKTNLRAPGIPGPPSGRIPRKIEAEFWFQARIVQVHNLEPVKVWGQMEWHYRKRWKIINGERYPKVKLEEY